MLNRSRAAALIVLLSVAAAQGCDSGSSSTEAATGAGGAAGTTTGAAVTQGAGGMAAVTSAATTSGAGGGFPEPPAGSPVAIHGQLSVQGTHLVDAHGAIVQLKGPSSMWLNWEDDGYAESPPPLLWMRDNWKLSIIRGAMGIEPAGAYLENPAKSKTRLKQVVDSAIHAGVYVIIDWHDHNATSHQAQAEAFFTEMSQTYAGVPNILYETFNEPLKVNWSSALKPYHQAIIAKIRANDPDNVIILGTPNWSQDVDIAAQDKVAGTNLMYTLHFYSCTHTGWLRAKGDTAFNAGLPMFVTEWGATAADGGLDGKLCLDDAQLWHDWMNSKQIGWTGWKLDGCTDSSCILKTGAPKTVPWTDEWLQGHGPFLRDRMKE